MKHPWRWRIAWYFTVLAAIGLLAATVFLAFQARQLSQRGYTAYVTAGSAGAYLRTQPAGTGQVLTVLSRGTPVIVLETRSIGERFWVLARAGEFQGWLPQSSLNLDPPE